MGDRLFAACCYGSDEQHTDSQPCPQDAPIAAARDASVPTLDDFIFRWFNERQPDEMQRCLDAHDEICERDAANTCARGEA